MRLVKPEFKILALLSPLNRPDGQLQLIELSGRVCYKSEDQITKDSAIKFVSKINKLGHESVLEHSAMTVKFICDRGVSHELVRHRLCSFSQESTRYCNYKGEVTFVIPLWIDIDPGTHFPGDLLPMAEPTPESDWFQHMLNSERIYQDLISEGRWSPQQARSVLPNSLKTEIVVTANFREWRHIFKLRCSPAAHPQMKELMIPLLKECKQLIPIIFDDIEVKNESL